MPTYTRQTICRLCPHARAAPPDIQLSLICDMTQCDCHISYRVSCPVKNDVQKKVPFLCSSLNQMAIKSYSLCHVLSLCLCCMMCVRGNIDFRGIALGAPPIFLNANNRHTYKYEKKIYGHWNWSAPLKIHSPLTRYCSERSHTRARVAVLHIQQQKPLNIISLFRFFFLQLFILVISSVMYSVASVSVGYNTKQQNDRQRQCL